MKALKTLLCALSIFLVFFAATSFAQDSAPKDAEPITAALVVAGFEGMVQVKIAPSTEWADATVGQALNPDDAIKTGENGQAMLQFSDKSSVALKTNTEMLVEELVWNDTVRKAGLNMPAGELRAIIKKVSSPSDFKVRTPTAICGARGTIFYIMTTGTETRVFVTDGSVDFTNPASGDTYVVVENMSSISALSGTVSEPVELTGAEKDQALAGWSGVIGEPYTEPQGGDDQGGNDNDDFNTQGGTPENPAMDNKGQQDSPASPI